MDKSSFLLCTDNNGQPILDEHGKYIYYCIKSTLTILNQLLGEASIGNKETAVNESISETAMNETAMSENTNENTANNKTDKKDTQKLEMANEDKFTHEMTIKLLEIVQIKFRYLNDKMQKKIWSNIAIGMKIVAICVILMEQKVLTNVINVSGTWRKCIADIIVT
ncbi:uncharacterized protein LOC126851601 isoform X2 [Cataglyphis hispanica]|uniref:uncharacterized protein LOC126851601 isoform X2 n=1 Tax=Cataglyphis hispanica TaxID=1086592 RepID=UPI00217FE68B|nr:uncharacterized protein LOC126851601 isoform X2 [Cataglyphis hispanica]